MPTAHFKQALADAGSLKRGCALEVGLAESIFLKEEIEISKVIYIPYFNSVTY